MMADLDLDPDSPPFLHLVSAFLAMEPSQSLISLARVCGEGLVTERVQRLIWDHCLNKTDGQCCARYLKNFLKKLINEIESTNGVLLDEIYEQYAYYMTSLKDNNLIIGNAKICKCISFLFQDGSIQLPSCPKSMKLIIPLQCSLNMLEGDTGCSIWPSSLFLSEFILSFPHIFYNKSCFEVGSGVGLAGICLAHVGASKIVLSDGDLTTLSNMQRNLELNKLITEINEPYRTNEDSKRVECMYLPWESADDTELQNFMPDIILGADVIYDPVCLPHLVRVLASLLNPLKEKGTSSKVGFGSCLEEAKVDVHYGSVCKDYGSVCKEDNNSRCANVSQVEVTGGTRDGPFAYIACVIRNIDTFNCFLELTKDANLDVNDMTDAQRPFNLLPYIQSYDRASIRLFSLSWKRRS